ncbi:MAG: hypothetical protein Q7J84_15960 [Sulfuricaulis sp.]|nr:hypothetical protein [Sulfuricaulis sp.]
MKKPVADAGEKCPLWQKDVSKVCHTCPWYTLLRGKNPQSGAEVDDWGCAISWLPVLLIETSKEVRQGAAATESFRNEMVRLSTIEQPRIELRKIDSPTLIATPSS